MGVKVEASAGDKIVAKVLCQGNYENVNKKYNFRGSIKTCASANIYAGGEKSCQYACLGLGDCVKVCPVNAIKVVNGVAQIDPKICVACGACQTACPKNVIAMLPEKNIVTVTCSSRDKGVDAKKNCKVACIGCGMCAKACPKGAITVENNVAYIDFNKCRMCTKCVDECPTGALVKVNFPVRKPKPEAAPAEAAATTTTENKEA